MPIPKPPVESSDEEDAAPVVWHADTYAWIGPTDDLQVVDDFRAVIGWNVSRQGNLDPHS